MRLTLLIAAAREAASNGNIEELNQALNDLDALTLELRQILEAEPGTGD